MLEELRAARSRAVEEQGGRGASKVGEELGAGVRGARSRVGKEQ